MDKFAEQRKEMIELVNAYGITDKAVLEAMSAIPRHLFVPKESLEEAYGDFALSIPEQQTISQPYTVAIMLQALELKKRDKVLEVIKYFEENSGDMEMICNSEGFIERWKNTNGTEILENAKKDLVLAKKRIALVTKAKNEAKKKYIAGAKKYKLETYV